MYLFIKAHWAEIVAVVASLIAFVDFIAGRMNNPYIGKIEQAIRWMRGAVGLYRQWKGSGGSRSRHIMALIVCCVSVSIMSGCIERWPECNSKIPVGSILRVAADTHQLCVRSVGDSLILVNGANISVAKIYTAQDALDAVDDWIAILESPISALVFKKMVQARTKSFPELMILTDAFSIAFDTHDPIDNYSREAMSDWLKNKVRPLIVMRVDVETSI